MNRTGNHRIIPGPIHSGQYMKGGLSCRRSPSGGQSRARSTLKIVTKTTKSKPIRTEQQHFIFLKEKYHETLETISPPFLSTCTKLHDYMLRSTLTVSDNGSI